MRRVRYFLVLAEELSFTAAAARLRIAQPSLSRQIKRLETEIGVELFERSTRRVRLTPAGVSFAADATQLRAEIEAAVATLRDIPPHRGRIAPVEDLALVALRDFIAIATHGGFRSAARRSVRSASAVAQTARRLGDAVGLPLLRSREGRVELTPTGLDFLEHARRLMSLAEDAIARAQESAAGAGAGARLGYIHGASFDTVPELARALASGSDPRRLKGSQGWPTELLDALRAGELDGVLTRFPSFDDHLDGEVVREEQLLVGLASGDPRAGQETLELGTLRGSTISLWPRAAAPDYFDHIVRRCRAVGFEPTIVEDALDANSDYQVTAEGRAVSLLNPSMVTLLPEGVVARPVAGAAPLPLQLVWNRAREDAPATRALRRAARSAGMRKGWLNDRLAEP